MATKTNAKTKAKAEPNSVPDAPKPEAAEPKKAKARKEPKAKKLSALDAAAQVLAEASQPMNCQEMIATMAAKGYWTSPNGMTPHAMLYSAILHELTTKRKESRFQKTERGKFARSANA